MEPRYTFLAEIEGLSVHETVGAGDGADAISQIRAIWPQARGDTDLRRSGPMGNGNEAGRRAWRRGKAVNPWALWAGCF